MKEQENSPEEIEVSNSSDRVEGNDYKDTQ